MLNQTIDYNNATEGITHSRSISEFILHVLSNHHHEQLWRTLLTPIV